MNINYYQTIPELGIAGRMNTPEEFEHIKLPKKLKDSTVLDIGCNIGAFLLESYKRGAEELCGVEVNQEWRYIARGLLTENIIDKPWAIYKSIEEVEKPYDVVLLLSVTHVVEGMTGQELLDKAWALTEYLLIIEVNDRLQEEKLKMPGKAVFMGKNKDNRSVYHIYRI